MNTRTRLPNGNISITKLSPIELCGKIATYIFIIAGALVICALLVE